LGFEWSVDLKYEEYENELTSDGRREDKKEKARVKM
jgi:hypothetical protein